MSIWPVSVLICLGYRKGCSSQSVLTSSIDKRKQQLDKKVFAGVVLMDLSKSFNNWWKEIKKYVGQCLSPFFCGYKIG